MKLLQARRPAQKIYYHGFEAKGQGKEGFEINLLLIIPGLKPGFFLPAFMPPKKKEVIDETGKNYFY